jgi:GABA(A) receptor-associated protein
LGGRRGGKNQKQKIKHNIFKILVNILYKMDSLITLAKSQYRNYNDSKVIAKINYKEKNSYEKRLAESTTIIEKYPERIPIICERLTMKVPLIDRSKYLCPKDLTIANFLYVIRKRLRLNEREAIYLFVNDAIINGSKDLGTIYEQKKDDDGFLYIRYDSETTFG